MAEQALAATGPAALFIGPKEARLTYLRPSNPGEKKELFGVLLKIAAILKGSDRSAAVPVSRGLYGYLKGEERRAATP